MCQVAQDLGKSLEEVMQLSVQELMIWHAYYNLKSEQSRETMSNVKNRPRRRR